jgi:hypothetical protein
VEYFFKTQEASLCSPFHMHCFGEGRVWIMSGLAAKPYSWVLDLVSALCLLQALVSFSLKCRYLPENVERVCSQLGCGCLTFLLFFNFEMYTQNC